MTFGAYGEYAFCELPEELDASTPNPFRLLLAQRGIQLQYLVEIYPYDESIAEDIDGFGAFGSVPFGDVGFEAFGGIDPLYLSDRGFTSSPTDSLPDTHFPALVDNALQYDTTIISGTDFGLGSSSYGTITIQNGDGLYDARISQLWEGRRVVVKAGSEDFSYDDYAVVFDGLVADIEADDSKIYITVTDKSLKADQTLAMSYYRGTGGLEGGDDILGKPKPMCFGEVFNIEPVLIDSADQIYQIHSGSIQGVIAVRDAGVELTFEEDVADILTAVVPAGHYTTQLSGGFIKLGSTPQGRITCDVQGANDNGYSDTAAGIIEEILTMRLSFRGFDSSEIDGGSLNELESAVSGKMGVWVPDLVTASEVIASLLLPVGAYSYFTRDGLFKVGILSAPSAGTATYDDLSIDNEGVKVEAVITPAWKISVGYAPLGITQGSDELLEGTDDEARAFLTQPYRVVSFEDSYIRSQYEQAGERLFIARLTEKADAEALLSRLAEVYCTPRKLYRATIWDALFRTFLTDDTTLRYPRHRLDNGKDLKTVSLGEDTETGATNLTLWG